MCCAAKYWLVSFQLSELNLNTNIIKIAVIWSVDFCYVYGVGWYDVCICKTITKGGGIKCNAKHTITPKVICIRD